MAKVVAFVKQWRHKRFCTCEYIKRELRLTAAPRTINRALDDAGFFLEEGSQGAGLDEGAAVEAQGVC